MTTEPFTGPLAYDDAINNLAYEYSDRVLALLRKIEALLSEEGYTIVLTPEQFFTDDYRWTFTVRRPGTTAETDLIDFTVELAEADEYEGDSARGGINWGLDIVEYGGRMLGGLTPYNYTERCWVPMGESSAVAERWAILEAADLSAIPELCEARAHER